MGGYTGIMEKKMETTIMGLCKVREVGDVGFRFYRVKGFGCRVQGL